MMTVIVLLERFLKRLSFRLFNVTVIGLIFGYFMGLGITLVFTTLTEIAPFNLNEYITTLSKLFLFLCSLYLGVILCYRYSEEFCLSIPFIKLHTATPKTKGLIIETSALADPRIVDLAATGFLNHRLIIPRFLIHELHIEAQNGDEIEQQKARRALENIKKLEAMSELYLTFKEGDSPKVKEPLDKVILLGRMIDADILIADDPGKMQCVPNNIKIISLYALSKALKPFMQNGEHLSIKMQRVGKEERQGVGYLEDGTMVVVNGGGEFIGNTIEARVLSVKQTQSGRLVFCNLVEDA
jgi:uncharacterized protein YacL